MKGAATRLGLVGVAVAALLVTGLAAPPASAQAPQAQAAAVTPAPNPVIDETCGLDATLILDASGSIQSAGAVNTVRNAGRDLTAALKDTNSTLRITQFATFSGQLSSRVPVNASTTGSGGALAQALASYYTPPPPLHPGAAGHGGRQRDDQHRSAHLLQAGVIRAFGRVPTGLNRSRVSVCLPPWAVVAPEHVAADLGDPAVSGAHPVRRPAPVVRAYCRRE